MSQVWLITDAARGAGRALADAVLKAGGRVVAGARQPGRLAALAVRYGARVRAVEFDAAREATVYAALDAALTEFGRLDVVVNNAGQASPVPIEEMSDTDLRAQFERNFFGVAGTLHAVLPVLQEQGAGRIVQVVERNDRGGKGLAARRAAQSALKTYIEALAREAAFDGVEIGTVEPAGLLAAASGRTAESLASTDLAGEAGAVRVTPVARVVRFPARPVAA